MQRPRTLSKLSESIHHQLNAYALAAGVAGAGALRWHSLRFILALKGRPNLPHSFPLFMTV